MDTEHVNGRRVDDAAPALLVRKREAARLLGVSIDTLDGLLKRGEVPCVRLGRRVLVPRAALEAIAQAHLTSI